MFFDTETVPTRKELLLDLAAFGGTVIAAAIQGWKAADIVWASWITSLLTGLLFFLVLSLKQLWDYAVADSLGEWEKREKAGEEKKTGDAPKPMEGNRGCLFVAVGGFVALLAWFAGPGPVRVALLALVGLDALASVVGVLAARGWLGMSLRRPVIRAFFFFPTSLFMIFFFLMHFGGFHLGHAFVLSFFVPPEVGVTVTADSVVADTVIAAPLAADASVADTLAAVLLVADSSIAESPAHDSLVGDSSAAGSSGADSLLSWSEVQTEMAEAQAEAREALIEARGAFFAFLGVLILTYWPYIVCVAVKSFGTYRDALLAKSKRGEEMLLPYKYVVRVHLMIFVLIPLAALGSGLLLTIVVLAFFFFPVESVVAWVKSR